MFDTLDMGASALIAQRTRLDTIAANVANINTIADAQGRPNPYQRRFVVFSPGQANDPNRPGVHVSEIGIDPSPPRMKFDPGHKLADKDGFVRLPNVDMAIEFVNALEASRAYEANVTMMETTKAMFNSSLRLIA